MEAAALLVSEVIAFVVRHEVDDSPLGQGHRLVQDEVPLLDTGVDPLD